MDAFEIAIYYILQNNPGMFHVTPDGKNLYLLIEGQGLLQLTNPDGLFHKMSEHELNEHIKEFLTEAML